MKIWTTIRGVIIEHQDRKVEIISVPSAPNPALNPAQTTSDSCVWFRQEGEKMFKKAVRRSKLKLINSISECKTGAEIDELLTKMEG
jgi:hypothetical protein